MAHGDAVGDGDRAEFSWCPPRRGYAFLHRLSLAHEGDIAGGGLVPARGDADERLVNLLASQPHRIVIGPMRRALRTLGYMPARQFGFAERLGIHRIDFRSPGRTSKAQAWQKTHITRKGGRCASRYTRSFLRRPA